MRRLILTFMIAMASVAARAENIDPYGVGAKFAWGENVGWLNFKPETGPGVQVSRDRVEGMVWAENIGWINLSPANYGGVLNDGAGNLSGWAWGENVGWISFSCDNTSSCDTIDYGVTIDEAGNFDGWAWGENIGWIHLGSDEPIAYGVQACKVGLDDLANFASYWLAVGSPAELDGRSGTDMGDFAVFSRMWLDFCPDAWQLKVSLVR